MTATVTIAALCWAPPASGPGSTPFTTGEINPVLRIRIRPLIRIRNETQLYAWLPRHLGPDPHHLQVRLPNATGQDPTINTDPKRNTALCLAPPASGAPFTTGEINPVLQIRPLIRILNDHSSMLGSPDILARIHTIYKWDYLMPLVRIQPSIRILDNRSSLLGFPCILAQIHAIEYIWVVPFL